MRLTVLLVVLFSFSDSAQIRIVEYNIDKNGSGGGPEKAGIEPQIALLKRNVGTIDILVLIEADRNCPASNLTDGPQQFQTAFGLRHLAYATEFKQGPHDECTTGNAILSRYPIEIVEKIDFRSQCCLLGDRQGARNMLVAKVSPKYWPLPNQLYVIATHLEAGTSSLGGFIDGLRVRSQQSLELAGYVNNLVVQGNCVLVAGDFNSPDVNFIRINQPVIHLNSAGFKDGLDTFSGSRTTIEPTSWTKVLKFFGYDSQLDYLFMGGTQCHLESARVIRDPDYPGVSDHYPITAKLVLK